MGTKTFIIIKKFLGLTHRAKGVLTSEAHTAATFILRTEDMEN
jgi:hypothetical protein